MKHYQEFESDSELSASTEGALILILYHQQSVNPNMYRIKEGQTGGLNISGFWISCDSTLCFANYSSCDAYNVEVKDYLKDEITGTYSEYTDDEVKCKLQGDLYLGEEGPKAEMSLTVSIILCVHEDNFQYVCMHIHAVAVKRLYESQRRTVLNSKPENVQRAQLNDIKKYRARRDRVRPHVFAYSS